MAYLTTYQRTYNIGGDDQQEGDSDTHALLLTAIGWCDTRLAAGWAAQGTLSTQVEITETT